VRLSGARWLNNQKKGRRGELFRSQMSANGEGTAHFIVPSRRRRHAGGLLKVLRTGSGLREKLGRTQGGGGGGGGGVMFEYDHLKTKQMTTGLGRSKYESLSF